MKKERTTEFHEKQVQVDEPAPPARRIVRGVLHTVTSTYAGRLVNLAAGLLLMRILDAQDFGRIALALSILVLVSALRNLGLNYALIHQHDRVSALAPTHFFINTLLAVASTSLALGIAFFYDQLVDAALGVRTALGLEPASLRRVEPIVPAAIVVFALAELFRSASHTAETELRRDLSFGRLAVSHGLAITAASITALVLASAGFGVWSLLFGYSVNSVAYVAIYCTGLWSAKPPPIGRLKEFSAPAARLLLGYGAWFWAGGIFYTLSLHYDRLVVGTVLNATALGIYERAQTWSQMPTGAITHAVAGVTGTVYARYQDDATQLSRAFHFTFRFILRLAIPVSIVMAVEAPNLVRLLVGEDWMDMVPVLRWLAVYAICRAPLDDVLVLILGTGRPRAYAAALAAQAAFMIVLAPVLTARLGLVGTALAMDVVGLVGLLAALRYVHRLVRVRWLAAVFPPLAGASVALTARGLVADTLSPLSPLVSLLLGGGLFATAYAATLLALEGKSLREDLRRLRSGLQGKS